MKRRILTVTIIALSLLGISSTAHAGCPEGSRQVAGGAPGLPSVCVIYMGPGSLYFVFPW